MELIRIAVYDIYPVFIRLMARIPPNDLSASSSEGGTNQIVMKARASYKTDYFARYELDYVFVT